MSDYEFMTSVFKALMHPTRLAILEILRHGEQCVCHMEALLKSRQAYISQHLSVLRETGLVEDRREGARIYYRVIKPDVFALVDRARQLCGEIDSHTSYASIENCPCPKCNQNDSALNNEETLVEN